MQLYKSDTNLNDKISAEVEYYFVSKRKSKQTTPALWANKHRIPTHTIIVTSAELPLL